MKYIQHSQATEAIDLSIGETDTPSLSAGHVLVRVQAFGVNRADILQRQGKYPPPAGESLILGLEVSGVIEAVGEQVSRWQIGDKVFGLVAGGGYAEYVAVNANHLMPLPENLSMSQGAAIAEVFLTAYQSLFWLADLKVKESVLIHAGASGVGLAAIQLAKESAANIIVTSSNQTKLTACSDMGANVLINYHQQDFVDVLKQQKLLPNVIVDFVAGDYVDRNLSVLALDGRIIYLAMLAGRYADKLDMAKLLGKRASLMGSTLRNRSDAYKAQLISDFENSFLHDFASGKLQANVDACYPASELAEAHNRIEHNDTCGKLVGLW